MNGTTSFKIAAILSIFLSFLDTSAQNGLVWKELGNRSDTNYYGYPEIQKCMNGEYYTVLRMNGNFIIGKWNGSSWSKYPPIKATVNDRIWDMELFNNELYVAGHFTTINLAQRQQDLPFSMIRFNGTYWDSLQGNPPPRDSSNYGSGGIDNLVAYNGYLYYLSHVLVPVKANRSHKLYRMNASGVHELIQSYNEDNPGIVDGSLCVHNHKLIFAGSFDTLEYGKPTVGIGTYDGTSFTYPYNASFNEGVYNMRSQSLLPNAGMHSVNDSVLVYISNLGRLILIKKGTIFKDITHPTIPAHAFGGMVSADNKIFMTYYYNVSHYYDLDSSKWKTCRAETSNVSNQSNGKIFGIRYRGNYPPRPVGFVQLVQGSARIVEGRLFADLNTNCTLDTGDRIMKNALVELDNGSQKFSTYTDAGGYYSLPVLAGDYSIKYNLPQVVFSGSKCLQIDTIHVPPADTVLDCNDIPVRIKAGRNLGVNFTAYHGFRTRQGFTENYVLTGANYNAKKDSLILKLKYPAKATFVSSDIVPSMYSNNELVFKFHNVGWNEVKRVNLRFSTSVATSTSGDEIKYTALVLNSEGDSMPENNNDTLWQKIMSAFDPNIKQCFPEGKVVPNLKKIKYVIHFQNTGSDTAYKVTVVDTITQKLGLRSIRVTSTSHPGTYSLRVDNKQALVWEFENILLPDSHTNEPGSNGFIAFEADINGVIAVGDSIVNKAYIYFDYQDPIKTNTASIVMVENPVNLPPKILTRNNGLKVYPNPAGSTVNVSADIKYKNRNIQLLNHLGQVICTKAIHDGDTLFDVATLARGIYFVKIEGTEIVSMLLLE